MGADFYLNSPPDERKRWEKYIDERDLFIRVKYYLTKDLSAAEAVAWMEDMAKACGLTKREPDKN